MVSVNDVLSKLPKPVAIPEKLTRKILRAVMSQFSSLPEALLELVDNAFDEFDGVYGGKYLDIDIVITKGSITVENLGGKGMGSKELRNWLSWGEPHKKDAIGEYGQGGKAAMGYLGSSWVVKTKRWDEPWIWEIKEDKWDDVTSDLKHYEAIPKIDENKKHDGLGYCKFEVRKLKKLRQDKNRIRAELSNIYRRYLEEGKASISVDYEPVAPLKLPIYEGFKLQQFKEKTSLGLTVSGWIGRLKRDTRIRSGPKITGGMRLLRKGRLIRDGEYFGHHDFRYKASLGTLIGEVELSRVPVVPNKTGFDTDSPEWVAARDVMYGILKPHIDDLLSLKEEETVSREERKRVTEVRELMIEAFKRLSKYRDVASRLAEERGRKSPEKQLEAEDAKALEELLEKHKLPKEERKPRTPPPEDAVGRLQRLGKMPEWEIRILPPDIRSEWGEREGRRCLLINKKYCLYEERSGDDIYLAETATLQLAKPEGDEKLSLEGYLDEVSLIMRAFCEVYSSA